MAEIIKKKKGAKKKFFEVEIPLTATRAKLYGYTPEEFNNKTITLDLTKNLRGKNVELKTKVRLEKDTLVSDLVSLRVVQSYIRKVMRRGTDYVEDSFDVNTKDNKLKIKPFLLTRNRVSRSIRNEIRKTTRKFIEGHCTIRNTKEIFSEIMTNKLQKALSLKIKKLYPLAFCEIRRIEVICPADKSAKSQDTEVKSDKAEKPEVAETPFTTA